MSKTVKILSAIVCSFILCFMAIGYAEVSDKLTITGNANLSPPRSVFITDAVQGSGGNGTVSVSGYSGTTLSSTVTLQKNSSSKAVASITVYNNAGETYAFNAVKYIEEAYSNVGIKCTPSISHGEEIAAGESLTFTAEFTFDSGATVSDNTLVSMINFEFLPLDELPKEEEIAVSGALEQFYNIINNIVSSDSYGDLIDQMDAASENERANSSYIGNVVGASPSDEAKLSELFQGNLKLNIDGVDTEVTILIKRENIDGNAKTGDANGNELTIYLTTDPLERTSWFGTNNAIVYAAVFSSNDQKAWYRLGNMYRGEASINSYSGNPFGEGSFNTDTWKTKGDSSVRDGRTISQVIASL